MKITKHSLPLLFCLFMLAPCPVRCSVITSHGLALFDKFKFAAGFKYIGYINSDASKGGSYTCGWTNFFDSVKPFIILGTAPVNQDALHYDRLMVRCGLESDCSFRQQR